MKNRILSFLLLLFSSPCFASFAPINDGAIDTADEVYSVNEGIQALYRGKLDLRPGTILPKTDSLYNLGASGTEWAAGYFDTLNTSTLNITSTLTSSSSGTFTGILTSSRVLVGDGSFSLPSVAFTADQDTGFMRSAANVLSLISAGSEGLAISNSQVTPKFAVRGVNGTASAPTYSFDNANNWGFYTASAGTTLDVSVGASRQFYFANNQFNPVGGGNRNSGDATDYWADISYKTLTDRGCLGWFDDGVQMQDGTWVSDSEAIMRMTKHPTKLTIYGTPMLDYRSFPKVSFKPAMKNGKLLPRDSNDEPYFIDADGKRHKAADGVEMTSVFSIMIGAIKEQQLKIQELEARIELLESGK